MRLVYTISPGMSLCPSVLPWLKPPWKGGGRVWQLISLKLCASQMREARKGSFVFAVELLVTSREVPGEGGVREGIGVSGCGLWGTLTLLPIRGDETLVRKPPQTQAGKATQSYQVHLVSYLSLYNKLP